MKKSIALLSVFLVVCIVFSSTLYLRHFHYIDIMEFEEKTSRFDFMPTQNDLVENSTCKYRVVKKGLLFSATYYELFVRYESEKDYIAEQQRIMDTYRFKIMNISNVDGRLSDYVIYEKDGFQYMIADIESLYGYPKDYFMVAMSSKGREFIFIYANDEDIDYIDDFGAYLKKHLYI